MTDKGKPAMPMLGDEPDSGMAGPMLSDPTEEAASAEDGDITDAQANAAELVASAIKKGDGKLIAKALKLFQQTCSY